MDHELRLRPDDILKLAVREGVSVRRRGGLWHFISRDMDLLVQDLRVMTRADFPSTAERHKRHAGQETERR